MYRAGWAASVDRVSCPGIPTISISALQLTGKRKKLTRPLEWSANLRTAVRPQCARRPRRSGKQRPARTVEGCRRGILAVA